MGFYLPIYHSGMCFLFQFSRSYICDSHGNITCLQGWQKPTIRGAVSDPLNPCPEPICHSNNGSTCVNGKCIEPDLCACEVGWEGAQCDKCIRLPGCRNGKCSEAFECQCLTGWTGAFCEIRKLQYRSK